MALREKTIKEIVKKLTLSGMSPHLFDVSTNGSELLKIVFKPKSNFIFILNAVTKKEMSDGSIKSLGYRSDHESFVYPVSNLTFFITKEAPGELALSSENYEFNELSDAIKRVGGWALRVKEECSSRPHVVNDSEIASIRKKFEEIILNADNKGSDGYFTDSEIAAVKQNLEVVQAKLEQVYEEQKQDKIALQKMKAEIASLQKSLKSLDKKTWRLDALNKILDTLSVVNKVKKEWDNLIGNFGSLFRDENCLSSENQEQESELENE